MKQTVKLSRWSTCMTWIMFFALLSLSVYGYRGGMPHWLAYSIGGFLILITLFAMIYMPVSISVDSRFIKICRPLGCKKIALADVSSVRLCPPTVAEKMICGSSGFFGHWGWFTEPTIGKYFAYYGKASDCFLVTLTDGSKYLLGCSNPTEIVTYINQSK